MATPQQGLLLNAQYAAYMCSLNRTRASTWHTSQWGLLLNAQYAAYMCSLNRTRASTWLPLNRDYYSMLSMQSIYIHVFPNRTRHCNPPLFGVVPRYFPSFGEYTTYFYSLGLNEGPQHLHA